MRLHQIQHQLNGNHGVYGTAAGVEHLQAGFHRQRVRGGDHVALRVGEGLFAAAAGRFGLLRAVGLRRQRRGQHHP